MCEREENRNMPATVKSESILDIKRMPGNGKTQETVRNQKELMNISLSAEDFFSPKPTVSHNHMKCSTFGGYNVKLVREFINNLLLFQCKGQTLL